MQAHCVLPCSSLCGWLARFTALNPSCGRALAPMPPTKLLHERRGDLDRRCCRHCVIPFLPAGKRPLLPPELPMSAEVADVINTFRMLAELPADSLGAYVSPSWEHIWTARCRLCGEDVVKTQRMLAELAADSLGVSVNAGCLGCWQMGRCAGRAVCGWAWRGELCSIAIRMPADCLSRARGCALEERCPSEGAGGHCATACMVALCTQWMLLRNGADQTLSLSLMLGWSPWLTQPLTWWQP